MSPPLRYININTKREGYGKRTIGNPYLLSLESVVSLDYKDCNKKRKKMTQEPDLPTSRKKLIIIINQICTKPDRF